MKIKNIILVAIISFIALAINAQVVVIPRSGVIEMHNGKSYYIHTVQKGQTVYSIAKAYDVTPDEIYFENPGAKPGVYEFIIQNEEEVTFKKVEDECSSRSTQLSATWFRV